MKIRLKRLEKRPSETWIRGKQEAQEREPDVLILTEAAEYLRISPTLLYKKVRTREVPCTKIGRKYVFSRDVLANWLNASIETAQET